MKILEGHADVQLAAGIVIAAREVLAARQRSEASQEHLAAIVDSAMDAIITVDRTQTIVLFNRAAEQVFRCRREEALGTAVSIELLHNALLIHDDIEDGSEQRRGHPTLHVLHGVPLALNAGDSLTLLSLRPLIENAATIGIAQHFALNILPGESDELGFDQEHLSQLAFEWILRGRFGGQRLL